MPAKLFLCLTTVLFTSAHSFLSTAPPACGYVAHKPAWAPWPVKERGHAESAARMREADGATVSKWHNPFEIMGEHMQSAAGSSSSSCNKRSHGQSAARSSSSSCNKRPHGRTPSKSASSSLGTCEFNCAAVLRICEACKVRLKARNHVREESKKRKKAKKAKMSTSMVHVSHVLLEQLPGFVTKTKDGNVHVNCGKATAEQLTALGVASISLGPLGTTKEHDQILYLNAISPHLARELRVCAAPTNLLNLHGSKRSGAVTKTIAFGMGCFPGSHNPPIGQVPGIYEEANNAHPDAPQLQSLLSSIVSADIAKLTSKSRNALGKQACFVSPFGINQDGLRAFCKFQLIGGAIKQHRDKNNWVGSQQLNRYVFCPASTKDAAILEFDFQPGIVSVIVSCETGILGKPQLTRHRVYVPATATPDLSCPLRGRVGFAFYVRREHACAAFEAVRQKLSKDVYTKIHVLRVEAKRRLRVLGGGVEPGAAWGRGGASSTLAKKLKSYFKKLHNAIDRVCWQHGGTLPSTFEPPCFSWTCLCTEESTENARRWVAKTVKDEQDARK